MNKSKNINIPNTNTVSYHTIYYTVYSNKKLQLKFNTFLFILKKVQKYYKSSFNTIKLSAKINKLKTSTSALIIFNIILCLFLLFSFIAENKKQKQEIRKLALVPPAVIETAQEIIFNLPADSVSSFFTEFKIIKENKNYILKTDNGKFYIRRDLIERFFSVLTIPQQTIFITADIKQYADYGLTANTAANIKFISSTGEILSDIYFGKIDAVGNSRYVTANLRTAVLSVPDNIAPFLNIRPGFWLDLQIYKSVFKNDSIQSLKIKDKIILRSAENTNSFGKLEKTLAQLNCIDIFTNLPVHNSRTEYFSIESGNKNKMIIALTPLEHGDFILSDSRSENAYVLSAYSKLRLEAAFNEALNAVSLNNLY